MSGRATVGDDSHSRTRATSRWLSHPAWSTAACVSHCEHRNSFFRKEASRSPISWGLSLSPQGTNRSQQTLLEEEKSAPMPANPEGRAFSGSRSRLYHFPCSSPACHTPPEPAGSVSACPGSAGVRARFWHSQPSASSYTQSPPGPEPSVRTGSGSHLSESP